MKSIEEALPLLKTLIEGMSKHFGDKVEFVVHDYSREYASSIVAIENGQVTGRSVGKGGTVSYICNSVLQISSFFRFHI